MLTVKLYFKAATCSLHSKQHQGWSSFEAQIVFSLILLLDVFQLTLCVLRIRILLLALPLPFAPSVCHVYFNASETFVYYFSLVCSNHKTQ